MVEESSVWYNLRKYEELKTYETVNPAVIFSDLREQAERMALHGVTLCMQLNRFVTSDFNGRKYNVYGNSIGPCVLYPIHNHDYFEFNYVFEGVVYQYINGESLSLAAGDLLVMNPSVFHGYYAPPGTKAANILVPVSYFEHVCGVFDAIGEPTPLRRVAAQPSYSVFHSPTEGCFDEFIKPLEFMEARFIDHPSLANVFSESLFMQLAAVLTHNEYLAEAPTEHVEVRKAETPVEIMTYLRENFATITLSSVADKFGYSRSQIERIIKKFTGFNFSAFIATMRINTATYLLLHSDLSVSEISKRVGIESTEYFYRLYKKHTGYTPLHFKRSNKIKQENERKSKKAK